MQIKPWIGLSWLDTLKERFEETDKPIENLDDIEDIDQYKLTLQRMKSFQDRIYRYIFCKQGSSHNV